MKRFLALTAALILAFSVMSCKTSEQDMAIFAIETAGMVAGSMLAAEGVKISPAMNEYYQMVMSGNLQLNESEYLRIQTYLAEDLGLNAVIVNRVMTLANMAGAEISGEIIILEGVETSIETINLEGVDMELVKAAFNGFMLGLTMGK